MSNPLVRFSLALKAVRELGPGQTLHYAIYQVGKRSGLYRLATPTGQYSPQSITIHSPFVMPDRDVINNMLGRHAHSVVAEADEIVNGQVRLFGGPPVPLKLAPLDTRHHWAYYENRPASWGVEDIKFIWEPARFGWVYPLGRAYLLTGSEKYPAAFWQYFEAFIQANPPNQGPNWASAQEAALRLMALLFAACAFQESGTSTTNRMACLAGVIAAHARRIPPTLSYARAQNNNHQVSEALGLYAAGCALPEYPQSRDWQELGWKELNRALQNQIQPDGTYAQHSMNYHRLMLHAVLHVKLYGRRFPKPVQERLAAATTWLLAQIDPNTGRTPNLGSNDGANILPLACSGFSDFRPVGQAAARAFLGQPAFPPGLWDEPGLWLGQPFDADQPLLPLPGNSAVHRLDDSVSWATLRAVRFTGRPAHADQLHVDLWWCGENVALDAGAFRYTAPAPWDNSLAKTCVHNTIEVNGQDQMRRAGRFLWLDWAQADVLEAHSLPAQFIAAQHNGYQRLGIIHRRILKHAGPGRWMIIDYLLDSQKRRSTDAHSPVYPYRLHWLLPDWPWSLEGNTLSLMHPGGGQLRLSITPELPYSPLNEIENYSLVRAGQALAGPKEVSPIAGWYSPTYSVKLPALSFSVLVRSVLPINFVSEWVLENGSILEPSHNS
jgi:hypothetical protein